MKYVARLSLGSKLKAPLPVEAFLVCVCVCVCVVCVCVCMHECVWISHNVYRLLLQWCVKKCSFCHSHYVWPEHRRRQFVFRWLTEGGADRWGYLLLHLQVLSITLSFGLHWWMDSVGLLLLFCSWCKEGIDTRIKIPCTSCWGVYHLWRTDW